MGHLRGTLCLTPYFVKCRYRIAIGVLEVTEGRHSISRAEGNVLSEASQVALVR